MPWVTSRPFLTITTASADNASSASRWLDTRTVPPRSTRLRRNWRSQCTPAGSSPLVGSSRIRIGGIAEQGAGQHQPLPHAQRETADPAAGGVGEFDLGQHLVDPAVGMPLGWARIRRWLRAVRPGWKPVASSAAPTLNAGRSRPV